MERIRYRILLVLIAPFVLLSVSQIHLPKAHGIIKLGSNQVTSHSKPPKFLSKNGGLSSYFIKQVKKHNAVIKKKAVEKQRAAIHKQNAKKLTYKSAYVKPVTIYTPNTYAVGWCTWWAKHREPWVPNNMGNAKYWGYNTKVVPEPHIGSVAWSTAGWGGHVAVVENIQGNRVYVSEMMVQGWNVVSYRWTNASDWNGFIWK